LQDELRVCNLAPHDRPTLQDKLLVDTPDVDSTELANREKLIKLLPIADVVLYVGSQEKYHDHIVWDLFKKHRQRRAFAFVLNKWDRCAVKITSGLRPDEDLLNDLRDQGFEKPLLFRTNAQYWVDKYAGKNGDTAPLEGEQFQELVQWLEKGLTRLEIEAIKARGVGQMLQHLESALQATCPPDLAETAQKTKHAWERILAEEAKATANILLNTLEPYQKDIEYHFTVESHRRFRGLMAGYLSLTSKFKYLGSSIRDKMSVLPRGAEVEKPASWDLAKFTSACSAVAGEKHLDARNRALGDRLLIEAEKQGYPLTLLNEPTENTTKLNWRDRYSDALVEVLGSVEQQWSQPTGMRRLIHGAIVFIGNTIPPIALFVAVAILLWRWFMPSENWSVPGLSDIVMMAIVVVLVMVLLHVIINFVLPLRWPKIRGEFQDQLESKLQVILKQGYLSIPDDRAQALREERKKAEKLIAEVKETAQWLDRQQQAASIAGLYGSSEVEKQ
jgi:hypothetical protein